MELVGTEARFGDCEGQGGVFVGKGGFAVSFRVRVWVGERNQVWRSARDTVSQNCRLPLTETQLTSEISYSACADCLQTIFSDLPIQYQYRPSIFTGVGFAKENVWSRAARRKIQHGDLPDAGDDGVEEAALGFKIRLATNAQGGTEVRVRWLQGHDSVLFESFCGMVKRQMS